MPTKKPIQTSSGENKSHIINNFFEAVVDNIKTDHLLISEDIATAETKSFYNDIIFGDEVDVVSKVRETSSMFFIKGILKDYVTEIRNYNKLPLKLALGLSDSKIMVWCEINDGDDNTEDALLLAEAKVNAKYYKHGFYLNSTIIEKSDNLEIPPHYHKIVG